MRSFGRVCASVLTVLALASPTEDLLASLAQFSATSSIRTELSDLVVVQVGESAAHAWAGFRTTVGEGPGAFSFGGAISFVLEREDGRWRLLGGHTSAPRSR